MQCIALLFWGHTLKHILLSNRKNQGQETEELNFFTIKYDQNNITKTDNDIIIYILYWQYQLIYLEYIFFKILWIKQIKWKVEKRLALIKMNIGPRIVQWSALSLQTQKRSRASQFSVLLHNICIYSYFHVLGNVNRNHIIFKCMGNWDMLRAYRTILCVNIFLLFIFLASQDKVKVKKSVELCILLYISYFVRSIIWYCWYLCTYMFYIKQISIKSISTYSV